MGASPWDSDSRVKDSRLGEMVNIRKTNDVGTLRQKTLPVSFSVEPLLFLIRG